MVILIYLAVCVWKEILVNYSSALSTSTVSEMYRLLPDVTGIYAI